MLRFHTGNGAYLEISETEYESLDIQEGETISEARQRAAERAAEIAAEIASER